MNARVLRKKNKNVSYFSHEYIINNQGDLFTIIAMVFVIGMIFKTTTPLAQKFLVLQHQLDRNESHINNNLWLYHSGKYDFCATLFYTIIFMVIHAVIQEYGLDKFNRKLNLTRIRLNRFNDAGQHACFFAASAAWALYILYTEDFITGINSIWEGYPHNVLPFWIKLFYIFQICFWLHNYPELYFQKARKEEIPSRVLCTTVFFVAVTTAYVTGLTKLCLLVLLMQYASDFFYYVAEVFRISENAEYAKLMFTAWNVLFFPIRIMITVLSFFTFFYGLEKSNIDEIDYNSGNFNTRSLRIGAMVFIFLTQAILVWNFTITHFRRHRESANNKKGSNSSKDKRSKSKVN